MSKVRIMIGDDEAGLRAAIRDTISDAADMEVVGEADSAASAYQMAVRCKPDVCLIDVRMPGGGPAAARAIRDALPATAVVALSAYEDKSAVMEMIDAGAVGYVVKGAAELEILDAIRRAVRGQLSLPGELGRTVVGDLIRELAERSQAETALRASEQRLQAVLSAAPDALLILDADGEIQIANVQAERLFGYSRDKITGQPVSRLMPRGITQIDDSELIGQREDGTEFPVETSVSPLQGPDGLWSVAAIRNITDRQEAERARVKSEKLFRGLLESAPDAMVIVDAAGTIQLVNARTEELFGYDRSELIGKTVDDLLPARLATLHPRHRARYLSDPHPRPMAAGLDLYARRRDGSEFPVDISLSPLDAEQGQLVVAAVRDISQRKAVEREVAQTQEVAERQRLFAQMVRVQEEERLKIASDIHDDTIQTMTAASLRLQQLRRHITTEAGTALLGKMESAVQESIVRLRRLMFDLRPPALDRSGLAAALRDLLDRVHDETAIKATLKDTLPAEPSLEVRTMAYRITQEAVANIRKHSQAKHMQIEVGASEGGCLVKVIDDGIGFDVSDGEKPGHLGIAAMRGRARMAGGWWRAESPAAGGTTVTFWIPGQPGSGPPHGSFPKG